MKKVRLYFLKDNGGYRIVSEHDNYIMILDNNSDLYLDQMQNFFQYLETIEDDSSWEYMEKDKNLEKILLNHEILEVITRVYNLQYEKE